MLFTYHSNLKLRQFIETTFGRIKFRQGCATTLARSADGYFFRYILSLFTYILMVQFIWISPFTLLISNSDKGSPWQNGYVESYFGKFKEELGDINKFNSLGEVIEYIYHKIYYYNNERIHTTLKMPPVKFKQLFFQKKKALLVQ